LEAGLLIVNADDLGYDIPTTDAILASHARGAVTSATALVWMSDSERAAELARRGGCPTGLHLNLIEPYTATGVPGRVRDDQARLCEHFAASGTRALLYDRRIRDPLRRCIRDQLEAFVALYGTLPTHWDGHRHKHLSLNVLLDPGPLASLPARRSFSYAPGEKSFANRMLREAVSWVARQRFGGPRYFHSIRDLAPELGGDGLERALARAHATTVEIMVHPGEDTEYAFLSTPSWTTLLAGQRTGSYRELATAQVIG
jgi:chitin disaccharide deacetylase